VIDADPIAAAVRAVMALARRLGQGAQKVRGGRPAPEGYPAFGPCDAAEARSNIPAQGRHRGRVRARRPRADQDHPYHGRARSRRETVPTVRTVRYQRQQGLRGRCSADGR
jgi:hypothetical protein